MKTRLVITLLLVAGCAGLMFAGQTRSGGSTTPVITQIEAQNLIYLREEEKTCSRCLSGYARYL